MEREEQTGMDLRDDVPVTQRCVYVQDRDSQKWFARAQVSSVDIEAVASAK